MSVEELRKLKFSALERMAHERGIAASVIDEAIDADSPKAALVALLAPASSPATEPEPDGDDVECNDDEDAWWVQPAFAQGGTDYCDVRLPPPAQHPTCCICGLAGHSREECAEPVPQMPGPDDDYRKVSGRERRGKSSGSGGAKRKKHGAMGDPPRNGAVQTFGSKRQKFAAESSSAHVRRQKSGKVREAGKRPKGGWAPNPKGGGGGRPKGKPKRPVKQTRRERRAEKRGVARYKRT